MSGYMPSVDDVRHVYKFGALPEQADSRRVAAEMEREFDRWLAEVVRAAKHDGWVEGHAAHPYFGVNPYEKEER